LAWGVEKSPIPKDHGLFGQVSPLAAPPIPTDEEMVERSLAQLADDAPERRAAAIGSMGLLFHRLEGKEAQAVLTAMIRAIHNAEDAVREAVFEFFSPFSYSRRLSTGQLEAVVSALDEALEEKKDKAFVRKFRPLRGRLNNMMKYQRSHQ